MPIVLEAQVCTKWPGPMGIGGGFPANLGGFPDPILPYLEAARRELALGAREPWPSAMDPEIHWRAFGAQKHRGT